LEEEEERLAKSSSAPLASSASASGAVPLEVDPPASCGPAAELADEPLQAVDIV